MIPNDFIHILRDVSDEILNAQDVYGLSKAAHRIVERFVPVPYSGIYLWIPNENKLKLLYANGFTDEENEINERTAMERHPGHVFKTKEILYVTDMHSEQIPEYVKDNKRNQEIRSRLWMPICTESKSLGSFGFASEKTDFFTQVHRDVLDYICRLVANQYVKMLQNEAETEYAHKLNEAYTKVNEAFKVQSQFTAKMNHELRTPLNSILGMLRILENTRLDREQIEHISLIRAQSQVLLNLVNDVLDMSKIQDKEFRIVEFDMNLGMMLKDIVRVNEFNATNKGIDFLFQIDKSLPDFIQSDELRLRQILNNLLGNAIKFTSTGNVSLSVRKSLKHDLTFIDFTVSDTGIGIPEENLPHVFDKFYQASEKIEISYGGSGLGLTIVKEIVDRMHGFIEVNSTFGKGTSFKVSVPLKLTDGIDTVKSETEQTINLDGRKILIVDDNAINCHFLQHIITNKGGQTEIVNDGQEAIERLTKNPDFDVILMDIRMPVMDGIECTKSIRNVLKISTPIIVQSGNTIERDIEQCYTVGANDFVSKPIDESDLFRKIIKYSAANQFKKPMVQSQTTALNENLIELFQVAISDFIRIIEDSIETRQFDRIQFELHKFKSSLKQLGYDDLSEQAIRLEKEITKDTDEKSLQKLKSFILEIKELKNVLSK